jgi:nitrate reductase gamma subunit
VKLNPLFGAWPYVALGLLIIGILLRYFLVRQLSAESMEMTTARKIFRGNVVWRASLILLVLWHVVLLATPAAVLTWNSHPVRLYTLEAVLLIAALVALSSWLVLLRSHLQTNNKSLLPDLCDAAFLSVLFVGLASGVLMAVLDRWGSSWGALILSPYLSSLLHGRPSTDLVLQMPWLVRLHVFSAYAAMAVFPLSRLSIFVVAGLRRSMKLTVYCLALPSRPVQSWLRKHNAAAWLWPEED